MSPRQQRKLRRLAAHGAVFNETTQQVLPPLRVQPDGTSVRTWVVKPDLAPRRPKQDIPNYEPARRWLFAKGLV